MNYEQLKRRREFLKVLAASSAGVGIAAISGCASPTPTPDAPPTAIPPTAAPVVVKETVQVPVTAAAPPPLQANLVWDTFRQPGTGWNEERIATFQALHPGVRIEFRPLTGASQQDNYAKMYALKAAGDLGDVVAFDPSHFQFERAVNKEVIAPIDDLVAGDNLDLRQWFDQFMTIQYYKGKLYGLPSWGWAGFDTLEINTVHFDEKGIKYPEPTAHDTSMQTIGEWARQFYDKTQGRYGLNFGNGEINLVGLVRAFGGDLINPDGTKSLLLDDKKAQEALKWAYDLKVVDKVIPLADDVGGNFDAAQLAGKLTMDWGGSLTVRNLKRDAKDPKVIQVSQVLFPARSDGKYPSQIRGGTWNINKDSKAPEATFQFIKHITNTEGSFGFNLVAQQGALVRPDVLALLVKNNPIHEWFIPNLQNGIAAYGPANSRGKEYTDAIAQWMGILLDPKQPVQFEKGLQDLHDNIQLVLDMPAA
jgi:ABC-type glycerol-3-phosphate transport system substrate-binding protein